MGDGGSRCVRLGRRSACGSHVLLLARGDAFYGTVVVSGLVAGSGRALGPLSLDDVPPECCASDAALRRLLEACGVDAAGGALREPGAWRAEARRAAGLVRIADVLAA